MAPALQEIFVIAMAGPYSRVTGLILRWLSLALSEARQESAMFSATRYVIGTKFFNHAVSL